MIQRDVLHPYLMLERCYLLGLSLMEASCSSKTFYWTTCRHISEKSVVQCMMATLQINFRIRIGGRKMDMNFPLNVIVVPRDSDLK
jgi:hypothetical protein